MNLDRVARAGKDRPLVALVLLVVCAVAGAACSDGGKGGGRGGGGGGAGGTARGGAGGTARGGAGGIGTGGAPSGPVDAGADVSDASPSADTLTDTPTDTPTDAALSCGDASGGDCCPDDPLKIEPGVCGCGTPDDDTDYDLVPNCRDMCPEDPTKTEPGACGCFIADTDTDHDGTADCHDGCPQNPARQAMGLCGCALPDTAAPFCLAHRYGFNDGAPGGGAGGAGGSSATATVRDSVGTANGTAVNVTLTGTGSLTLAGGQTDQYVSLPAGIISGLGNSATFEAWISWPGTGGAWQRVFDFGASDSPAPGGQGVGQAFVFFSPLGGAGVSLFTVNTVGLTEVMGSTFFPQGLNAQQQPHHLACVIDAGAAGAGAPSASFYIDGTLVQQTALLATLSGLNDVNNWLGRSQFLLDPEFTGTYYEFRIHSSALTQQQITASIAAGPDALP